MANRRGQRRQQNPYAGLGSLVVFALIIIFIASFWQVIIGCLITAFIVYVVWRFREEICQGIAGFFRFLVRFFSWSFRSISTYVQSRRNASPNHGNKPQKKLMDNGNEKANN